MLAPCWIRWLRPWFHRHRPSIAAISNFPSHLTVWLHRRHLCYFPRTSGLHGYLPNILALYWAFVCLCLGQHLAALKYSNLGIVLVRPLGTSSPLNTRGLFTCHGDTTRSRCCIRLRTILEERVVPVTLQSPVLAEHLLSLFLACDFHDVEDTLDPVYSLELVRLTVNLGVGELGHLWKCILGFLVVIGSLALVVSLGLSGLWGPIFL